MRKKIGDMLPMRDEIKVAAIRLFSIEGYESATVRKIAEEANVSPGQINFYFRGKDKLYSEIMEEVNQTLVQQFHPIKRKITAVLSKEKISKDDMWKFLEYYVDTIIDYAFKEENQASLRLVFKRVNCNEQCDADQLTQTIKDSLEIPFADLLREYYQLGYLEARTISRCINGSLFSFVENEDLFLNDVREGDYMPQALIWLKGYLKKYLLNSISHIDADK